MDRAIVIRAGALYVPLLLALVGGRFRVQPPRQFAACLLSFLWALPTLVILQRLNAWAGWWSYASAGPMFYGMPLELYLCWVVLWGVVPELVFPRTRLWVVGVAMVGLDLLAMPACAPVVVLGRQWLVGEAVAVAIVLVPALLISRWTLTDTYLPWRAGMQVATAALVFLYWGPEVVFCLRPGLGWEAFPAMPGWERQVWLQIVLVCAIPGVAAVMEFVERGSGTPIPYDPPKRLVASGVYRYCANPMQMSCALVMVLWAAMLRSWWLLVPAGISIVYSAGIAEWDERDDLERRFGEDWRFYRREVKNWRVRWTPYAAGPPAKLYVARTCGPCSEVRAWFEARTLIGLALVDAETLAAGTIRRIRYVPAEGSGEVEGVRAVGRALEHLHVGWAFAGAVLRLPGVWWLVQTVMDASGLGPRDLVVDRAQNKGDFCQL
jgi:protein-S-isoprenylcysteine O-methyltransferase Ste14